MANNNTSQYRGKRALILTRVSGKAQEKNFSHAAQERGVREKLVLALGMYIADEQKHIVHDTYTGLEYRYREALDRILEMAEAKEFDVLCMDVLDRGLGRKALARELYRMQLQEFGVRILTTDPTDHADDDSLEGQIMRFHKGIKAEEEIMDLKRRTHNGKREKALGNPAKGIPGQLVGWSDRLYGYKFILNEKGVRVGYELNHDIIYVEPDGTEWTEVKVIVFIFESAAKGVSVYEMIRIFHAKGIPTPYQTSGKPKKKGMKEELVWQHKTVLRWLRDTAFYGEMRQFKQASIGRLPGHKTVSLRRTSEDEQIITKIPAIVTKQLWEKVKRRITKNKQLATRNNKYVKESLLRGGSAKCAYCGHTLYAGSRVVTLPSGERKVYFYYECDRPYLTKTNKCPGCNIPVGELDRAAAEYIIEIIRDPSVVDRKIAKLLADNPISKQRQRKMRHLNDILNEQDRYRKNLAEEMRKKTFSARTAAYLNQQLEALEQEEETARRDLADEQRVQQQQEKLQARITGFHQQCQEWREKINDPQFTPDLHFNLDAVIFFGITVTVWNHETKPRYEINVDPPEIVELLS